MGLRRQKRPLAHRGNDAIAKFQQGPGLQTDSDAFKKLTVASDFAPSFVGVLPDTAVMLFVPELHDEVLKLQSWASKILLHRKVASLSSQARARAGLTTFSACALPDSVCTSCGTPKVLLGRLLCLQR